MKVFTYYKFSIFMKNLSIKVKSNQANVTKLTHEVVVRDTFSKLVAFRKKQRA